MNRQQRRETILIDLQQEMRSLHDRRRRQRRILLSTFGLVLAAFGAWQYDRFQRLENGHYEIVDHNRTDQGPTPNDKTGLTDFRQFDWIIHNSSSVIDKYVVSGANAGKSLNLKRVDDEELLELLQLAGKPGQLGIIDGQKMVIPLKTL